MSSEMKSETEHQKAGDTLDRKAFRLPTSTR
jgi:hypothetical protein